MAHVRHPEPRLVNQPTNTPTRKVTAAALSGAIITIAIYIGGLFDFVLPPEVAAAATVLLSFVTSWLTKEYNSPGTTGT